jgi:hypothetical protein
MINGEYIEKSTVAEQQQIIAKYLNDYIEIISQLTLVVTHFPIEILDLLRGTNALLFLANSYCLTVHLKRDLSQVLGIRLPVLSKHEDISRKEAT